ncbi:MAG: VTT domain-containing protein, partial [Deltaproteobacteria bacterium]|nr:VTT domain-containing protein [Deltaproteobacteria bacterium]
VCPEGLSPSAAFFAEKRRLVREDRMPPAIRKTLENARRFARTGHRLPFSFYPGTETVFWPGCGLAANRPDVVRRVREILSRRLQRSVGVVLDCCFDPVYGLGDTETAYPALRKIGVRLRDHGVRQVITGCLNCHKLLSEHLEGIEVVFVLEVLPPESFEKQPAGSVYLHHPCPSSRWETIRRRAAESAGSLQPLTAAPALCCGNGGGLRALRRDLADRFLDRIATEAENRTIVTYCTGCQSRFIERGRKAVHLLECLPGMEPRRKNPSPLAQWLNRLSLSLTARASAMKLLAGIAIAFLIAGGFYLNQQHLFSSAALLNLLGRHPVLAPLIFMAVYAVAPTLFLPSIPITVAAGFFWGPAWGVVFAMAGATLGSCLPFFLARYLFQEAIRSKVPPDRWEWLQERVARHGWKAVAFTRLVPVFPFNLLNYLFGLTPIPFAHYLWSTFVFMLPGCIAFVAFGSSLGEWLLHGSLRGVWIGIAVAALAFSLPWVLRRFFRQIGENRPGEPEPSSRKPSREKEI